LFRRQKAEGKRQKAEGSRRFVPPAAFCLLPPAFWELSPLSPGVGGAQFAAAAGGGLAAFSRRQVFSGGAAVGLAGPRLAKWGCGWEGGAGGPRLHEYSDAACCYGSAGGRALTLAGGGRVGAFGLAGAGGGGGG